MTSALNLKSIWLLLGFIGIQYSLGRRGSYPYGLLLGFSLFKITAIVVVSDMIQTALLLNLLVYTRQRYRCLKQRWQNKHRYKLNNVSTTTSTADPACFENPQPPIKPNKKKKLTQLLEKYGSAGLIFIAALPYGGGALTGSIVAVSIKMAKPKAFVLITIGCIIGSFLYYLGFLGIMSIF